MKRFIVMIAALALVAAPSFAQQPDTDGDGIPDAVEYELGSDPDRAEQFVLQHRDGVIGEDDETVSERHEVAPDFVEIHLANVAQDRWLWKITFADDYVADTNTFILYVDVDGDPETGRQDAGWVRGTDLMFTQKDGQFSLARHTEGMHPGEPRMAIVGDAIYICADLPLGEGPGEPRFRVLSHVSPPNNADSDQMEFQPVIVPERRDAVKPRIGAPPAVAPVAELATDQPDASGDGIPDHVKRVLGMPVEEHTAFHFIGEDGTVAGGDEEDSFELANDVHRVYFANAAGDRYVWRIDFADDFEVQGRLVILYLDANNDRSTGRQENAAVQGTDIMLVCSSGTFNASVHNADVLSDNRDLRGLVDGKSLYYSMDLKLFQNREGNSEFRARVLSQYPATPGDNDNAGWFEICGPGESATVKPRAGSMAEIYSDGAHVEAPWLYWRDQLREIEAVTVDLTRAEMDGMYLEDRALVTEAEGATATVRSPVAGEYHLNVVMQDSLERHQEIAVAVDGERIATLVMADNDGLIRIFSIPESVTLSEGTPISFTSDGPAQDGRIVELLLTREMLQPPGMAIHDVAAYCPPAQAGETVDVDVVFLTNDACIGRVEWGRGENLDETAREERVTYSHLLRLEGLERGATYSYRVIAGLEDDAVSSEVYTFVADFERPERCGVDLARVELAVTDPVEGRPAWAVSGGIPLPEGHLSSAEHCRVRQGVATIPADFRELAWWPDGSVKWLLVSLLHEGGEYVLEYGEQVSRPEVERPIVVEETAEGLRVTTDVLRAEISREQFSPPGELWLDLDGDGAFGEAERIIAAAEGAVLVDAEGNRYSTAGRPVERLVVEEAGPVRTVVLAEGRFAGDAGELLGWSCRMYFTRGFPGVPTVFTLKGDVGNSIRPPTMTQIESLTVPVQFAGEAAQEPVRVLHDYDNRYIITRDGEAEEHAGHLSPTGELLGDGRGVTVAMRNFWQMYPKAFSVAGDTVTAEVFPELPADQYQDEELTPLQTTQYYYWLQDGTYMIGMGVALSYDLLFYASGGDAAETEGLAEAWDAIPLLTALPEHYCASGALGDLEPEQPGVFEIFQGWVDEGLEGLENRRRRVREYDWMNFGDTHGERVVNWTNQEYDLQWGLLLQFVRSGDWRYFERAEEAARHTASVDTVHFAPDESLRGIQKAHCLGHIGGFSMERPENAAYWFTAGIWNTGHMWSQGQLTTWCLTGDRRYLDSGMILVEWFAREETRHLPEYVHRSPGWSALASLGGYHVEPHPWYLNAARLFLQNTIARQCPGTGTLIHLIGECECPVKHAGGKTFMTGVVMSALKMLDQIDPDPELKNALVRSADWIGWRMWQPENNSFQYAQCAQFDGRPTHAGTYMICEGLAEAYNLSGNPLHREMLERSLGDMIVNQGPSASGKGYAMQIRMTPYALSLMQHWGMTELSPPPPPDPTVGMADTIYLPADSPALLSLRVTNLSRQQIPARVQIAALPDGLTADRSEVEWSAGGGVTLSPVIRLSGDATGEVRVRYAAGEIEGELTATLRPASGLALGEGVGMITGEGDPVAQALGRLGIELAALPDLDAVTLGGYHALLVGSEAHSKDFAGLREGWPMLLDFIGAGGRVALIQLQDSDYEAGFLPLPMGLSNDLTALAEITTPEHPLFADGAGEGLVDCTSYDSITSADEGWTVLARDRRGNPSIVEASIGDGAVLVIQPSPDRYVIGSESPAGALTVEACEQLLRNVIGWLERP
ncbi:MAG: hypothetical protein ACOX9R_13515 [Armatimonadota bacterium]|jgi:hypothetical protein